MGLTNDVRFVVGEEERNEWFEAFVEVVTLRG